MGLIRALASATGSVVADQWKEFFTCDALSNEVLVARGVRKTQGRGFFRNNKGSTDIITSGSVILVNEGQVALIVDNGRIAEVCAEAGAFRWDASSEPSVFCGNFGKGLVESFQRIGHRFTFGGDLGSQQRVYYINVKEIPGNKFGTQTPMPYDDPYYKTVLYIRYFGQYSFRISDPVVFFSSIAGNVSTSYTREALTSLCTDEFVTALDTALGKCGADGIKYSLLPVKQREIAQFMSETLDDEWREKRGMEIVSVALNKVTPDDKSRARIEEFDTNRMHADPSAMAGGLAHAQMKAMRQAAANPGGAMNGFIGLGMAQQATGGAQTQTTLLEHAAALQKEPAPAREKEEEAFTCTACGHTFHGKFCPECGARREAAAHWVCPQCGTTCTGRFCAECGTAKPTTYTCSCGHQESAPFRFCPECGKKQE